MKTQLTVITSFVLLLLWPIADMRAQTAGQGNDSTAVASSVTPPPVTTAVAPPVRTVEERVSRAVSVWERQISLSQSQRESIAARAAVFVAERESLKADTAVAFSEKVRLISAAHDRYLADVRALLTAGQRSALEAKKAEQAARQAEKTAGRKEGTL